MTFKSAIQRAAVLVKSLPQKQAAKVLAHLDTAELQAVFREIRSLESVSHQDATLAQSKFMDGLKANSKNKSPLMACDSLRPFEFLECISNELRYRLMRDEHPAIIAAAISMISTQSANDLICQFDATARVGILKRLCQTESLTKDKITRASSRIQDRLQQQLSSNLNIESGIDTAAKLLSCTDNTTRSSFLEDIQSDSELTKGVTERIFEFTDIVKLNDADVKQILSWVDTSLWAPALCIAEPHVQRKIFKNMAEPARLILQREVATVMRGDTSEAVASQSKIIAKIFELSEKQMLRLPTRRSLGQRGNRRAA